MKVDRISNINNQDFNGKHHKKPENKLVHRVSTVTSALGVGTAYALIAKKQGFSLSPKRIYTTPIKDWTIFKLYNKNEPNRKLINLEEKEIFGLASGSVAGGFLGGAVTDDKNNLKAKGREALNQLLGNVLVPVLCVGGVSRIYNKFKPQILKKVPTIPLLNETNKFKKYFNKISKPLNKFMKNVPFIAATLGGLGAGIILGNRVSNLINEKLYHKKVDRKIRCTDFAPHVDDVGMAVTLMADKSLISTAITNTVPLFLCVPGIETGTAIEKHHK